MSEEATLLRVLYDFKADGESELSVSKGESVRLLSKHGDWLMVEKDNGSGMKGFVPTLYVTAQKNNVSESKIRHERTSSVDSSQSEKRKSKVLKPKEPELEVPEPRDQRVVVPQERAVPQEAVVQQSPSVQKYQPQTAVNTSATLQEFTPSLSNSPKTREVKRSTSNVSLNNQTIPSADYTRRSAVLASKRSNSGAQKSTTNFGFLSKLDVDEPTASLLQTYETNEKIFKQTLQHREEAFKNIEEKLDAIALNVLDFQESNDQLIDKIRRLESRIESDRASLINSYSGELFPDESKEQTSATTDRKRGLRSTSKTSSLYSQ